MAKTGRSYEHVVRVRPFWQRSTPKFTIGFTLVGPGLAHRLLNNHVTTLLLTDSLCAGIVTIASIRRTNQPRPVEKEVT